MIACGDAHLRGAMPSEACVRPEPFIAELAKRGIRVHETPESTRLH